MAPQPSKADNSNSDYRRLLLKSLLDVIRSHLIISQFTEKTYGTSVTPTSAFILVEIQYNPGITIAELALMLNLNKSTISRAISNLIAQQFLAKSNQLFKLLSKASRFLALQDSFNDRQLKMLSSNLSPAELRKFADMLWQFTENSKAPMTRLDSQDPKQLILIAIRRLTRLWQLLGSNAYGSNLSPLDWLILSEIHYNNLSLSQIAEKLGLPINTLSQRVKNYCLSGLVEQKEDSQDQRFRILSLTASGISALAELEELTTKMFARDLSNFNLEELENFIDLFRRYANSASRLRAWKLKKDYILMPVFDKQDLQQLRQLLIKKFSGANATKYQIPDYFFSADSINFKIVKQSRIVGGLELRSSADKLFDVINLVKPWEDTWSDTRNQFSSAAEKLLGPEISLNWSSLLQ